MLTCIQCRHVHNAQDQCAFVKANCLDEDAGLFSYLSLYYCDLRNAKSVAFTILALWLALLFTTIGIAASDFFCINLSTIASILGMSESMAGVTFLAFGNGSPDVFSTFAAMSTHSGSLAVGELIGAAGFITAVVAGSMALVREFKVGKKTFVRDIGFFIFAASFTMVFLADGKLRLWECIAMVAFYLFYVLVVVIWHWYLGRQHQKRVRDSAARGHYYAPGSEELEVLEEDDEDEDGPATSRHSRANSSLDAFGALERAQGWHAEDGNSDDDAEERGRLAAVEMANEMRVTRPRYRRKNTGTAIRPSLLGALEFRSVLSSLQRSRSSHSPHIHLRRYSDENLPPAESHIPSDSEMLPEPALGLFEDPERQSTTRLRAVSLNDVPKVKPLNLAAFNVATIPEIGVVGATPTFPSDSALPSPAEDPTRTSSPRSPTFTLSPIVSGGSSRASSPAPASPRRRFDNSLAPPELESRSRVSRQRQDDDTAKISSDLSERQAPPQPPRLMIPHSRNNSLEVSPTSITRFPLYTDSPMPLSARSSKPPSISFAARNSDESPYISPSMNEEETLVRWWPYRFLPSPQILLSTLFPTLYNWRSKNLWDKFVSLVSAPSIFMLAITLPVVESEGEDGESEENMGGDGTRDRANSRSRRATLVPDSPSLEPQQLIEGLEDQTNGRPNGRRGSTNSHIASAQHGTAAVAVNTENIHGHSHPKPATKHSTTIEELGLPTSTSPEPRDWNRWLLSIQIFTAPMFIMFIFWANSDDDDDRQLIKPVLYVLLASLVTYAILIVTTTPDRPPKYRFLFCFVGFVVSIAWISTIANEVVGVLKAFGVILGISDAILGLTIFAVGNSLGDLVADITVAKLGYPVMALSACFGMLSLSKLPYIS